MWHIEDSYLQGGMIRERQSNVTDTCCLLTRLGFAIHSMKSVLGAVETLGFSRFLFGFLSLYLCPLPAGNVFGIIGQCLGLMSSVSISVKKQIPIRITIVVS